MLLIGGARSDASVPKKKQCVIKGLHQAGIPRAINGIGLHSKMDATRMRIPVSSIQIMSIQGRMVT